MTSDAAPLPNLARGGMRVMARIVDVAVFGWLFTFILFEIVGRLFSGFDTDLQALREGRAPETQVRVALVVAVTVLVTEVLPTAFRGATLGKALLGMRVVRDDTLGAPGLVRSIARWLVLFGAVVLTLGGWVVPLIVIVPIAGIMFFDPLRRGLHDRAAGTIVIEAFERGTVV